jgi:hypothetical protein
VTREEFEAIPWVEQKDATLCWAAALEWWGLATRQGGVDQNQIMCDCEPYWVQAGSDPSDPNYGTLSILYMPEVAEILRKKYGWAITAEIRFAWTLSEEFFMEHLPCFTAFPLTDTGNCPSSSEGSPPPYHSIVVYHVDRHGLHYMDPAAGFRTGFQEELFACLSKWACAAYRP